MVDGKLIGGSETIDLVVANIQKSDDAKETLHAYLMENEIDIELTGITLLTKK